MTDAADIGELVRETEYVLIKRDLFECPKHQGYTGIRDKAGTWPLEDFSNRELPIKDSYTRSHEHYALPLSAAPEFTNACFDDLARDHLIEQRNALEARCAEAKRQRDEVIANTEHALHQMSALRDRIEREPVVKALEWRDAREGWGPETYEASVAFGAYSVFSDEDSAAGAIFVEFAVKSEHFGMTHAISIARVHDWDEAKAAAQADYKRRILSAHASAPERVEAGSKTPGRDRASSSSENAVQRQSQAGRQHEDNASDIVADLGREAT